MRLRIQRRTLTLLALASAPLIGVLIAVGEGDSIGPALAARIDAATQALVAEAYARARQLLTDRQDAVAAIAERLVEVETMDGAELDARLRAHPSRDVDGAQRSADPTVCRGGTGADGCHCPIVAARSLLDPANISQ